ncbi:MULTISPECIES: EMC6-like membrane protein [unclassified Haloparvum]|uniref:EMC6-like membrane protein n=1 Tax=Haloparvum sp. PAK95 TaxID=3418962 RepID=UPI003D2EA4CB
MSDEPGISEHARGVVVTTIACLGGIAAAIVSAAFVGTTPEAASSMTSLAVLTAFILVEIPVMYMAGVDITEFGAKDNLYVAFMTFTLWFISYAVLLSSSVQL